jgi:hypothetical protein
MWFHPFNLCLLSVPLSFQWNKRTKSWSFLFACIHASTTLLDGLPWIFYVGEIHSYLSLSSQMFVEEKPISNSFLFLCPIHLPLTSCGFHDDQRELMVWVHFQIFMFISHQWPPGQNSVLEKRLRLNENLIVLRIQCSSSKDSEL